MSSAALAAFAARARATARFGLDTEFVGEGRYRTLLCVIQLVVSDEQGLEVLVLDALEEQLDLAPLAALLADPQIEVVVHAGRQDVALLRRCAQTEVTRIFDTQIAAGFAGSSAQAGYDTLLRELLGIRLSKSASFTRWDRRPLNVEQLAYAREDVLHLLELAGELEQRLTRSGRLAWALEECRFLERVSDAREPEHVFSRLPRINSLSPTARAIALSLVRWREERAERADRPASSVLGDAPLVEIAKRRPTSVEALEHIRGVNPGSVRRGGAELLAAVERGAASPPIPVEAERRDAAVALDAPQVALAEALVRARALDSGLAYELIAARADLAAIVAGVRLGREPQALRTLTGWRRELVGEELLALLRGELALAIASDRTLLISRSDR